MLSILWVLLAAFLSSVFTLLGAWLVYRQFLSKTLDQTLEELGARHEAQLRQGLETSVQALMPEFREELVQGFEQAATEMLPQFKAEVAQGFEQAAEALLPKFRQEVEEGFHAAAKEILPQVRAEVSEGVKEALMGVASVEFVDKTAQTVAKKGSKFFESGLNAIFGRPKKEDP